MAFAIPKIEYKNVTVTGDITSANATVLNVDTTDLEVGMFVRGTGIPTSTAILTVGATSIVLTKNATATTVGVSLDFGVAIEFDYPPKEKEGEKVKSDAVTTVSLSGIQQVSLNYLEGTRKPIFSFVSQAIYTQMKTFLNGHALYGNSFRYFEDKTTTSYVTYELDKLDYAPKKIAPKGVDVYVWEIPLEFRRVVA
jgi:hypothetical protein